MNGTWGWFTKKLMRQLYNLTSFRPSVPSAPNMLPEIYQILTHMHRTWMQVNTSQVHPNDSGVCCSVDSNPWLLLGLQKNKAIWEVMEAHWDLSEMPRRTPLDCYEGRESSLRTCFKIPKALERIISRHYGDESSARPLASVEVAKWLVRGCRNKRENMKRVTHFLLQRKNRLVNLGSVVKLWRSPDAESLSSMLGHQLTWNRRWTRSQSYFCLPRACWVVSHSSVNGLIAKLKVTNVVISWQLKSTVALMKFLVKGTDTK